MELKMTITLENVDNQFLQVIKSLVALKPDVKMKEDNKKDIIKEELEKDIELYRQGKLETITLDELKEHCSQW